MKRKKISKNQLDLGTKPPVQIQKNRGDNITTKNISIARPHFAHSVSIATTKTIFRLAARRAFEAMKLTKVWFSRQMALISHEEYSIQPDRLLNAEEEELDAHVNFVLNTAARGCFVCTGILRSIHCMRQRAFLYSCVLLCALSYVIND